MFHNPTEPDDRAGVLLRVPMSISHCGLCGQPTLEHDDQHCQAVVMAKFFKEQQDKFDAILLAKFKERESAGDFDCRRMLAIKKQAAELWDESATWPRTPWWVRIWKRLRSWF